MNTLANETSLLLPQENTENANTKRSSKFLILLNFIKSSFYEITIIIFSFILWNSEIDGISKSGVHILAAFICVILFLLFSAYPIATVVTPALLSTKFFPNEYLLMKIQHVFLTLTQSFKCETLNGLKVDCVECGIINKMGEVNQCDGLKSGFDVALSGFSKQLSWLVLLAFHIGKAVEITNLGKRISLIFVRYLGNSYLGLGYAIFATEVILSAFIPSNTARGGGIVMPVVISVAKLFNSTPTNNAKIGQFLILCGNHANFLTSSFFLTSTIGNPLIANYSWQILGIEFGFLNWAKGSLFPGIVAIVVLVPLFAYLTEIIDFNGNYSDPPETSINASCHAKETLKEMGPMSNKEITLCSILFLCLSLWVTNKETSLPEGLIAFIGLTLLILSNTISWSHVIENASGSSNKYYIKPFNFIIAWDSFYWLSGMILLSEQLNDHGITTLIGEKSTNLIRVLFNGNFPVFFSVILGILYTLTIITGHTVALCVTFMSAAKKLNCPLNLIVPILGFSKISKLH
ncbi:hypothetical protein HK099_007841 [Clydaea vesicula]|uniref:Uncharacterized protein n=1 Tax=Clydaea vesicula TaxID=447962 RepID=A0AAD5U7V4_9FUNG|nr:hypothetical protein HK099_007841 [Clydaea vesicula]